MTEGDLTDPVVVALAAVGVTWVAAIVRALVAVGLGDDTPRRAGLLRAPHRLLDRTGSVLVPSFLALAQAAPVAWPAPLPLDPQRLATSQRVAVALAGPVVAAVIGLAATALVRPAGDAAATVLVAASPSGPATVGAVALLLALLWLLPVPQWPGGVLVGTLLRGERSRRWQRLARRSATPWGLAVGLALVVLPDPVVPLSQWVAGIA